MSFVQPSPRAMLFPFANKLCAATAAKLPQKAAPPLKSQTLHGSRLGRAEKIISSPSILLSFLRLLTVITLICDHSPCELSSVRNLDLPSSKFDEWSVLDTGEMVFQLEFIDTMSATLCTRRTLSNQAQRSLWATEIHEPYHHGQGVAELHVSQATPDATARAE